jgi:DNA repair protein RecO (recombination protein O)
MAQPTYTFQGIVLRRTKLSESDLILNVLASDGSLKRLVAKGARKPRSAFAARTDLTCEIEGLAAVGRNLDILKEARLLNAHHQLQTSVEGCVVTPPLLELLGRVAQENLENPPLYALTHKTLRCMDDASNEERLALGAAALLKMLAFSGFRPHFTACISCGSAVDGSLSTFADFSALEGGVVCPACTPHFETVPLNKETLHWAHFFLMSPLNEVKENPVPVSASFAVLYVVQDIVRAHIGRPLKSLEFLFVSGLF